MCVQTQVFPAIKLASVDAIFHQTCNEAKANQLDCSLVLHLY